MMAARRVQITSFSPRGSVHARVAACVPNVLKSLIAVVQVEVDPCQVQVALCQHQRVLYRGGHLDHLPERPG